MKLKGISTIEQHIEKIVLAVFALFFLGMFVLQFDVLGDPNAINIGNRKVSPENAASEVAARARQVQAELDSGQIPDEFPDTVPSISEHIEKLISGAGQPAAASIALGPRLGVGGELRPGGPGPGPDQGGGLFVIPEAPAPNQVIASVHEGAMSPLVVARHPEVSEFIPAEQPFDFASVSVQASFDAAALRASFESSAGDEGARTMPSEWIRRVAIVDVVLHRQRLDSSGQWVEETEIAPMPGRFSLRQMLRDPGFVPARLPELYKAESDNAAVIRRPAPYETIAGVKWVWPGLSKELRDQNAAGQGASRLMTRRAAAVAEIAAGEDRIAKLEERKEQASDREKANIDKAIADLQTRLEVLTADLEKLDEQLRAQGIDPEAGRRIDDPRDKQFEEPMLGLMDREAAEITVWAHDYSAERGQTYRYRAEVWVTNPLFGHRDELTESQRPHAERPAMVSAPSEWSDPIIVPDDTYLFVTDAAPPRSGLVSGPASARVEMYKFYYGYWRRAVAAVAPGDAIRGVVSVPGLVTYEVADAPADGQPDAAPTLVAGEALPEELPLETDAFLVDVADSPAAIFVSRGGVLVRMTSSAGRVEPMREWVSSSADESAIPAPEAPAGAP